MKKIIVTLAFLVSMSALASGASPALQLSPELSPAQQQQQQQQSSVSAAQNAGNAQTVNYITPAQPATTTANVNYSGDYTIKNVPSVNGPNLTTSNDTCMGSSSGSLNVAGFGIGGGSTWVDTNCRRLKNAREFWNMGMKAAAMALLCNDSENKDALELTGFVCPQTTRDQDNKASGVVTTKPVAHYNLP